MRLSELFSNERLLAEALLVSAALHFCLLHTWRVPLPQRRRVEIDITSMGHAGAPAPPRPAARPAAPARPVAPPKTWTKPSEGQKTAPAPVPTKPVAPEPQTPPPAPSGPPGPPGEIGLGTGEGGEGLVARLPQLKNLSDLSAILQRFYPARARDEGREAVVVLDIHIDESGAVTAADLVRSADADFDQAALHAARLLRFTPAFAGGRAVAVKMRQAFQFKLEK
jgi:TonB family protein